MFLVTHEGWDCDTVLGLYRELDDAEARGVAWLTGEFFDGDAIVDREDVSVYAGDVAIRAIVVDEPLDGRWANEAIVSVVHVVHVVHAEKGER